MEHSHVTCFPSNQFVEISVRRARTHIDDGKAQFTDYEIELTTNHIAFTKKNSNVRRRYSDFVWLRNRLLKDIMITQPPQLPIKRLFGRFNKDFIKQRQNKLKDFLFGLVKNNLYLSHAAVHLFLQSKLSVEEIEKFLATNKDEEACDTILAESECKARLNGLLLKEQVVSKHDIEFVEEDKFDWFMQKTDHFNNNGTMYVDTYNDGDFADIESEIDDEKQQHESDDELVEKTKEMRVSCLPAPMPTDLDFFESSVEYLYTDCSSDSDGSSKRSTRSSTMGSTSNIKDHQSPTKKRPKRKYSRGFSTRKSMFNSIASLPDFHNREQINERQKRCLRRSKSFYGTKPESYAKPTKLKPALSHNDCKHQKTPTRTKRSSSSVSSVERTPVKRKISLNEYIIVGRESLEKVNKGLEEEFKTSL